MAHLHQILAIEKGLKSEEYSALTEWHKLCQKSDLFNGLSKTYRKRDEEGEDLPPERKKVQFTVRQMLQQVRTKKADYLMHVARKEWTNCHASADIVLDGRILVPHVPVTYLLFLEKQLTDLRTFIDKIPVLDTTEDWTMDLNSGLFKTAPLETHRTKKIQRPLVLYEATKDHPAQTQLITEDIIAGFWATVKESGACPIPEQQALAMRVERVLQAVKEARAMANSQEEVAVPPVADALLTYLFG